jgi:formylglycine-generating enzyme required for sulfatase activity
MSQPAEENKTKERFKEYFSKLYDELSRLQLPIPSILENESNSTTLSIWDFSTRIRSSYTLSFINDESKESAVCLNADTKTCVFPINQGKIKGSQDSNGLWSQFSNRLSNLGGQLKQGTIPLGLSLVNKPLIFSPPWNTGIHNEFANLDAYSALAAYPKCVLLGPPGSGKSTIVKCIAICHAAKIAGMPIELNPENLGLWPKEPLTPIFIELREFFRTKMFLNDVDCKLILSTDNLLDYLFKMMFAEDQDVFEMIKGDLQTGKALLIFDGLDETPVPDYNSETLTLRGKQIKDLISSLSNRYPKTKIIITSRPGAYSKWSLQGFERVRLLPLNIKERGQVAQNTLKYLGKTVNEIPEIMDNLNKKFARVPRDILQQPLFITLFTVLFSRDKLHPYHSKAELIHESILLLLGNWSKTKLNGVSIKEHLGLNEEEIFFHLTTIAYKAHHKILSNDGEISDIDIGLVLGVFYHGKGTPSLRQILDFLMNHSGVLESHAPKKIRFAHRLYEEFLVAMYFFNNNSDELIQLFLNAPHIWHEPLILYLEICKAKNKDDLRIDLLERLLIFGFDIENKNIKNLDAILIYCEYILQDSSIASITNALRHSVQEQKSILQAVFRCQQPELSFEHYAKISETIASLGDDRAGVGVINQVPDISWVSIDAEKYLIGSNSISLISQLSKLNTQSHPSIWNFDREVPEHELIIPPFEISLYPVTNEQYMQFVDDKNGYLNNEWWIKDGLKWRDEFGPIVESSPQKRNYPATNVSWYEAKAFCMWLSSITKSKICLPTEAQWEAACNRQPGDIFPLGFDIKSNFFNTAECAHNRLLPVGTFPSSLVRNEGKELPRDMIGNVWEWCNSAVQNKNGNLFKYPYDPDDGREEYIDNTWMRSARGGYYRNDFLLARTSYRGRDYPDKRYARQGFRLVRVKSDEIM